MAVLPVTLVRIPIILFALLLKRLAAWPARHSSLSRCWTTSIGVAARKVGEDTALTPAGRDVLLDRVSIHTVIL